MTVCEPASQSPSQIDSPFLFPEPFSSVPCTWLCIWHPLHPPRCLVYNFLVFVYYLHVGRIGENERALERADETLSCKIKTFGNAVSLEMEPGTADGG